MIDTAVIAAAGKGTRMLHLASKKPKHLIRVKSRPFLYYVLKNLSEAGIKKMILVVGHKKEEMEKFAEEYGSEFNLQLIDQFEVAGEEKYGTAIPIQCVENAVKGESFIAIFGDNLYSPSDIKSIMQEDNFHYVSGFHHDHPEKYGVLSIKDGMLKDIVEKPEEFISDLINTGLAKFTPEIFEEIPRVEVSPRGEYELTDAIRSLAQKGRVKVKEIQDYWLDFGNPGDVLKVSKFLEKSG